jgi:hypothetical protein
MEMSVTRTPLQTVRLYANEKEGWKQEDIADGIRFSVPSLHAGGHRFEIDCECKSNSLTFYAKFDERLGFKEEDRKPYDSLVRDLNRCLRRRAAYPPLDEISRSFYVARKKRERGASTSFFCEAPKEVVPETLYMTYGLAIPLANFCSSALLDGYLDQTLRDLDKAFLLLCIVDGSTTINLRDVMLGFEELPTRQ